MTFEDSLNFFSKILNEKAKKDMKDRSEFRQLKTLDQYTMFVILDQFNNPEQAGRVLIKYINELDNSETGKEHIFKKLIDKLYGFNGSQKLNDDLAECVVGFN